MKTMLQVLFGLIMGTAGVAASVYLGLLLRGQPDWRTGVGVLIFLAVTQWVAFFAFRHRIALQVLFGLVVCAAVTAGLIYSTLSFFWETRYPDGSNPITWRSDVALLLLLSLTQWVSSLVFRWFKRYGRVAHP
jgi:hypothetical protein